MTPVDVAWIAGIIEGEGCLSAVRYSKTSRLLSARIIVDMTDLDVVEKLHKISGMGKVWSPKVRNPTHKAPHRWQVALQSDVERLTLAILPHLGARRTNKAKELLACIEANREAKLYCKKGLHLMSPANTFSWPFNLSAKLCRACSTENQKRQSSARRARMASSSYAPTHTTGRVSPPPRIARSSASSAY